MAAPVGPQQRGQPRAGVVDVQHKRAQLGVPDHADRRRVGGDPLEAVQVDAVRVGDHRLDDVAVCARHPQRVGAMLCRQPPIVFPDRRHRARLHLRQALTAGEYRRAGVGLHHLPQGLAHQLADLAARPFAVVHFGEPVVDERRQTQRVGQRLEGAAAAQQRRTDQRADRQVTDPVDQAGGLFAALVVEVDALGTAGEHARGVRGGAAVS